MILDGYDPAEEFNNLLSSLKQLQSAIQKAERKTATILDTIKKFENERSDLLHYIELDAPAPSILSRLKEVQKQRRTYKRVLPLYTTLRNNLEEGDYKNLKSNINRLIGTLGAATLDNRHSYNMKTNVLEKEGFVAGSRVVMKEQEVWEETDDSYLIDNFG